MSSFKVSVKWNKEKFEDLDLCTGEPPLLFKAQVFALTGVQPERQKIMFKGKTLGNETWADFGSDLLKSGAQLFLLGSADTLPQAPKVKSLFMEDLNDAELAKALAFPAGLKNLGNTCYMNATLQCLKVVPELTEHLKNFEGQSLGGSIAQDPAQSLTSATRDLFDSMDKSGQPEIIPLIMVNVLHTVMPQFAQKDDHGHFCQQDANEFWLELMRMLQNKLKTEDKSNVITRYFGGRLTVEYKCKENVAEIPTSTGEDFLQLSCFLSQDVKYLSSGLRAKMTEEIVKQSPSLSCDAKYEKHAAIDRLPAYLTVQMVRFFYKERDKVNAKILKDVKFPLTFDALELCSENLREKLMPNRELIKLEDEKAIQREKISKLASVDESLTSISAKIHTKNLPTAFPNDPGSNNSGFYELRAVLTHKGRSSSSGHYVAWVKRGPNDWLMCDDENLTRVDDQEILKLSGGGDWHCAYLLLYGPKQTEASAEIQ